MKSNKELMAEAREALTGKWAIAIGIGFLYTLIINVVVAIPGIGSIATYIISGPMLVGISYAYWQIIIKNNITISDLFAGFTKFGRHLGGYLLYMLIIMAWSLLFVFAAIIVIILDLGLNPETWSNLSESDFDAELITKLALSCLFLIPACVAQIAYSQTSFIYANDAEIGAVDALKKSCLMMKGYKWKYFFLGLRFIGWGLLCILTFFIGYLWLFPYMMTSYAAFYEDVKAQYEGNQGSGSVDSGVEKTTQATLPETYQD